MLSVRPPPSTAKKQATLVICVLGIYSCYLSAGMLQEAISSYRSPDGGRYTQCGEKVQGLFWQVYVVSLALLLWFSSAEFHGGERRPADVNMNRSRSAPVGLCDSGQGNQVLARR